MDPSAQDPAAGGDGGPTARLTSSTTATPATASSHQDCCRDDAEGGKDRGRSGLKGLLKAAWRQTAALSRWALWRCPIARVAGGGGSC
jgi:hypothetical protein